MQGSQISTQDKQTAGESKQNARRVMTVTRFLGEVDRPFLIIVLLLVCIGSIVVFSSSYSFSAQYYDDPYYLARPQLQFVLIGLVAMTVIAVLGPIWLGTNSRLSVPLLRRMALPIFAAAWLLNLAVPFMGEELGGATRWIVLFGIQFQPSEFLKFALVLVCAQHIVTHRDRMHTFRYGVLPLGIYLLFACSVTLMQKHLSATIINCLIVYAMMWLGGTGARFLGAVAAAALALATSLLTFGEAIIDRFLPHALIRLKVWRDPFAYMYIEGGKGWQPSQSLYAISSGGFWGLGLGQSKQKHGYLPEPYNDYIFSIWCEETGFFGAVLVVALFAVFAWRGYYIATHSKDPFSSLLVMGITVHVVIQVILNIAVVTNFIPSTGISLPFFSYGGTSLIILLCEMGLVLAVSRYSYAERG